MKDMLKAAYEDLRRLRNAAPSWENYAKIADLTAVIKYYEDDTDFLRTGEIGELLGDIRDNLELSRAFNIVAAAVVDFSKDLSVISPHLCVCLTNKIKERLND